MKNLLVVLLLLGTASLLSAQVHVRGYTRKDGTSVAPYTRSSPNGTKADNYSTKGNVNPYTGKEGTKNVDGGGTGTGYAPGYAASPGYTPASAAARPIPANLDLDGKVVAVCQMPDGTRVTNVFNARTLELEYSSTNSPTSTNSPAQAAEPLLEKPEIESSTNSPSTAASLDANVDRVTADYAQQVNHFANKNDMTVEEVMRWDYVLTRHGLTLADFDQALAKLGQSRDRALGYHVEVPKRNIGGRQLVAGEVKLTQNPVVTRDEESMVKMLKAAGY